ncbi:histone deacetylase 11 [Drosophila elegans]|uniref:histone deacetylase 11 n=1 Tax=Drosophila elegans TaxID=30023 RepID=UPI0007E8A566|nr:histone deacetylase 11 [Drosophila elegans]
MKRLTERVHHEEIESEEVVWVKREDARSASKLPIVYSRKYAVRFAGLERLHPFDAAKGKHIEKLLCAELQLDGGSFYEPKELSKEQLRRIHTRDYLKSLEWSMNVACIAEVPVMAFVPNRYIQRSYLRPMRFQAAGSILAGKLALDFGWAINLGGGFHHCCSYRGGGFCPYADISLLIIRLFEQEPFRVRRVMIVDLDAHQGNGHERDFGHVAAVYILDMYNAFVYPKDHVAKESIRCAVELRNHTEDAFYLRQLRRCLMQSLAEFRPDVVIYNAGTDVLKGDPLGNLAISPEGVIERDRLVFSTFRALGIPVVMLLSGGYLKASAGVIADSIVNLKQKGLLNLRN